MWGGGTDGATGDLGLGGECADRQADEQDRSDAEREAGDADLTDEVADAEGDGGEHYFDFSKLRRRYARALMPRLLRVWDGGPVNIEGTVSEGDDVAGFKVVHLPGHAPGMIGLWRESDRLALVSDTTYTLDPETGRHGPPRLPHRAFNKDTEQARASIRKLARRLCNFQQLRYLFRPGRPRARQPRPRQRSQQLLRVGDYRQDCE